MTVTETPEEFLVMIVTLFSVTLGTVMTSECFTPEGVVEVTVTLWVGVEAGTFTRLYWWEPSLVVMTSVSRRDFFEGT